MPFDTFFSRTKNTRRKDKDAGITESYQLEISMI